MPVAALAMSVCAALHRLANPDPALCMPAEFLRTPPFAAGLQTHAAAPNNCSPCVQGWVLGGAHNSVRALVTKCPRLRELNFVSCDLM